MRLGIHLRGPHSPPDLYEHLAGLYGRTFRDRTGAPCADPQRIYFGDEFCPHRLPSPAGLRDLVDLAAAGRWEITLLTPPLSDIGLRQCEPLLQGLSDDAPGSEVVVNDWGVALFLQHRFPALRPVLGRLLNKGLKDPRLGEGGDLPADLLNRHTFENEVFQQHLAAMGIRACERDLLPFEDLLPEKRLECNCAIYFPYGYVTTGRVCWTATMGGSRCTRFAIRNSCDRPCQRFNFELEHESSRRRLIQNGNTVFYLYPPELLEKLFARAGQDNLRLIYQGAAL